MKLEQDMILTSKIFALLVQKRYLNMTHVNRYNVYVRICKILAHTYNENISSIKIVSKKVLINLH